MYRLDPNASDQVVALEGIPPPSPGAPLPQVLADEHSLALTYLVQESQPCRGPKALPPAGPDDAPASVALVTFPHCYASFFGPPNDEALHGHPLYGRGLEFYRAHVVRNSSWIAALERMNAVHPEHHPDRFAEFRHFVFTFHDTTFECVATGYEVDTYPAGLAGVVREMQRRLGHRT